MQNILKGSILIFIICITAFSFRCKAMTPQCVILLHGLARTHVCMSKLAFTLKRYRYIVINEDYPSTTKSIAELADLYLPPMIAACEKSNARSINFVTHSMGGIILQRYLKHHTIPNLGRIVMLSPPNHGSQIADLLHNNLLYKLITGPAGQELMTCTHSTPNKLNLKGSYQIGIIAGTFNFIPFGNYLFDAENDGAVSITSAKSEIMKDFISFPISHPFIMDNVAVHEQILYFLHFGKFKHKNSKRSK